MGRRLGSAMLEFLFLTVLICLVCRLALARMHFWHERLRDLDTRRLVYEGELVSSP